MSSDLIAWIVAIALGAVVLGVGWRRNLGAATRSWLPRFGEEEAVATPVLSEVRLKRRPLSPRQRRWVAGVYLLSSLVNAASAISSTDERLVHALIAGGFAFAAALLWLEKWPPPLDGPAS